MTRGVSVVVPVKDGALYLDELLDALLGQAEDAAGGLEVLVIDSGSSDRSVAIARSKGSGVSVLEIPPAEFGHGRTRNLGAERTTGDVIVFLTQDATPAPGWLAALLAGFELADDVGAVYGPHLARPDTSPMIARELAAFFAGHAGLDGGPRVKRTGSGEDPWLSNVNAAYRRDCWEAIRFADLPYSEDQAFAHAMLDAGWALAYHPEAGVLHAHDYPPADFARRYFDEYRGLRETVGHVERLGARSTVRTVRDLVAADRAWMREQGYDDAAMKRWTGRALVHHSSRKVFGALGSRAHALPAPVQRRLSLEGTVASGPPPAASGPAPAPVPLTGTPIPKAQRPPLWQDVRLFAKVGVAPLLDPLPGQDANAPLHIACVVPPFDPGSGGHNTIFQLMWRLERMGHNVSIWVHDFMGYREWEPASRIRRSIRDGFAPLEGPVYKDFDEWFGADVVIATGWQTAHSVAMLPAVRARVYMVNDHEPEFYATSAESLWAAETYRMGMHAVCASPWLADLVRERYGCTASHFDLGVDHDLYHPWPIPREPQTIALYGRASTPRRAVPLAIHALLELFERGYDLRVLSFGDPQQIDMPFPWEHLGVRRQDELAGVYAQATVGVVLSLTNYSLIPNEMLACGLPCVDIAGISAESVYGDDGPVTLTEPNPIALADAIERLLTDREEWQRRSEAGLAFVRDRTWDVAAQQMHDGIREALRLRLAATAGAGRP